MKLTTSYAVTFLVLCAGCANVQSPTGGPKDKTPPRLVSSIPVSNQTNFTGTTILLTFDEPVKINSPREEIIISPSPGRDIEFQVKNNRVFITPKERWRENTTYSIQFREGIQDITEANAPSNLKLAFSTGPLIDSLVMAGQVTDMLMGTPLPKITVAIYSEDTFDIFDDAPMNFTMTDKNGNFQLENISVGRFRIYAFNDKNKNLKVESRAEMFGFLKDPIYLAQNVDTLALGLVQLDSRPIKVSSIRSLGHLTRVKYSKALLNYTLTAAREVISAFGDNTSEINVWNPEGDDSLHVVISARDSMEATIDTAFYIKRSNVKSSLDKFTVNLGGPSINPETGKIITTITFSKPVRSFLYDSLYIKVDTTARIPVTPQDLTYVPARKQLLLSKDLGKKMFGPEANPMLVLIMKKSFAVSADNDTIKAASEPVLIYWPEENGIISIQAQTRRSKYILQLIEKTSLKVVAEAVNTPNLTAKNIPPSDYFIRAILDTNANGKWDPGNIHKQLEPERIIYYQNQDGKRNLPVRANWEVGPLQFRF
jgi:uncharacterized protein (DUF1499 family)